MSRLQPGAPAPWFRVRSASNPRYEFHTVAGRPIALCFFGSAQRPGVIETLGAFRARGALFDDRRGAFFGVSCDPRDEHDPRLAESYPGFRQFWDFDLRVGALFDRCAAPDGEPPAELPFRPATVVLDRALRVVAIHPLDPASPQAIAAHVQAVCADVEAATAQASDALITEAPAPVLVVPRVLDPAFCRELIAYYEASGGEDSGYMKNDERGRTVGVIDYSMKRRRDRIIEDEQLRARVRAGITRCLLPQIRQCFQFQVTHSERYLVACYDAGEGGYFRPHRDNTTRGTAHRRFAVTMNLNTEEYEGGELRFPEFGEQRYRAPTGGAVVFSCSMLHEALPVTRGRRYCVLPFLYDDAAAALREKIAAEDSARG